ncbi:MAG: MG2 domain-containing protein [Fuerstiella sp.]|nr:MG2 domain-containing protein [Fuerstiella sp.]
MRRFLFVLSVMTSICCSALLAHAFPAEPAVLQDRNDQRVQADKLFADNNFAEALTVYQDLALDEKNDDAKLTHDFGRAVNCITQLNRSKEFDEFFENTVTTHESNWRLLFRAAQILNGQVPQDGYLIAGQFERGPHRGGGKMVSSAARDRVRAIQLLQQALPLLRNDQQAQPHERSNVYHLLSDFIGQARWGAAWKLQDLTDLTVLPDYEEPERAGRGMGFFSVSSSSAQFGRGFAPPGGNSFKGAPVDTDGNPVFIQLPASWEAAKSDGERWRWALQQTAKTDPGRESEIDLEWAAFLQSQFGVHSEGPGVPLPVHDDAKDDIEHWVLRELADTETVARLATGTKRVNLPNEFNHIAVINRVIAREDNQQPQALETLVNVRMNREQYGQAADLLKRKLKLTTGKQDRINLQSRIDQILNSWVQFQSVTIQVAGKGATFDIRYRNGAEAAFTARPIDIDQLLADTKSYLQSKPGRVDYQKTRIEDVGFQLINNNQNKYLEAPVAKWNLELTPPDHHFDAIETVTTPLQKAGAYFVTGRIKGGNEARMVIWVADTAITRKRIEQGTLHYVADAVSGKPIGNADVEFFGWRQQRLARTREYRVLTQRFADRTDKDGLCVPEQQQLDRTYQWLTIVRTKDGRMAYDGFNGVWNPQNISPLSYSPIKVYSITDRPVYRPEHTVKFRLWVRQPRFSQDDARYANKTYVLQIRNPKGDVVLEKDVTTDRWAGIDGEWPVPDDATLGRYALIVGNRYSQKRTRKRNGRNEQYTVEGVRAIGQGSFQIEEYRKPEFEVTIDAPDKPVMLGEKIQAKINAKYYFGAPVTEATVHYKIERTKKDSRWYPVARWDWLYSPGYWWFSPDHEWYPGWSRWGCYAPIPIWRGWSPDPPEIIVEGDAEIDGEGMFLIDIDTATALREHSDSDHNYKITAEVVDQSRRTITGTGNVLVAREPFKVFVWTDRGHYRSGDTVQVGVQARTPDGKPVKGSGTAVLYAVTYQDNKPVESEVESWNITTADDGRTEVKMVIPDTGQFRISVNVTDAEEHEAEGGCLLFVRGVNQDGRGYRFNDLELITEKREYQPGETVTLQINTNKTNSTVLLFVRPMNGLCPKPQVLQLDGKSTTVDLSIARDDMPNIFVEALTIADGRIHSEVREIIVPPEKKIAHVEVLPSAKRYRPGDEATVRLKLTDLDGKPFVGDTVLSVYDASLEYIAASSIPEIRSFFWNVRRRHNVQNQCTLQQASAPTYLQNEVRMQILAGNNPNMLLGGVMGGGFGGGGGKFGRVRGVFGRAAGQPEMAMPMMMMEGAAPAAAEGANAFISKGFAEGALEGHDAALELPQKQPTMRSNFADTAHWVASATSDDNGIVDVKFKVPDNLTTWKIKAWTLGNGTRVGSGTSDIISSKDLIIRPQTPRFFTETDLITLSAVVHNYLDSAKSATVVLETEGGQLQTLGNTEQVVQIPAGGEVRVDWNVQVTASGNAKVRMKALTDEESDATELMVPAHIHGILKTESFTGIIRPDGQSASVDINVPTARIEEQSRLEVRFSPTLAGAMVDALPYLIDYPYGCTEQTLNHFLPAAITQQTLKRMGVDLADVQRKRTNLNAQEIGDAAVRAAQWKRYNRNPVFDEAELARIVATGVTDLTNMQLSDGGWGWFSGFGEHSTAHLTSQVVRGLTVAQRNNVPILADVLQRGVQWLKTHQSQELSKLIEGDWRREHPDRLKNRRKSYKMKATNMDAFVAFVLTEHDGNEPRMTDYLYRDRGGISVYAKALTGLVLHFQKDVERRNMVLRNIEQSLVQDDENQTAYLRTTGNSWWYWYGSENEAMARYLQLLLAVNPDSDTALRLVKYLLNNRKHGTYWNSTRDTAIVVEAMADYIAATGEDQPDMTVEVLVDGMLHKKVRITAENLFGFDNVMLLEGDAVKSGAHRIELRRSGSGPVYFNAYLTNFTKEDSITAAGLEVKVQRRFYKLEPDDKDVSVQGDRGQVVGQRTAKFKRISLDNLSSVTSGDLIEVELIVDSKNDYEYLLLEDRKPSGFEPDDQRSGYIFEGLRAYRELRDDRVSFFLSHLARGQHSVSYRLRAETPSQKVSALPANIEGMYAPELVGNSNEFKLRVTDR